MVMDLRAEGMNSNSILVSWDLPQYPNAPIVGYVVYFRKILNRNSTDPSVLMQDPATINIDGYTVKIVNHVNVTETVLDGLQACQFYSVIVQAVGEVLGAKLSGELKEVISQTLSDFQLSVSVPIDSLSTVVLSLPDYDCIETAGEVM